MSLTLYDEAMTLKIKKWVPETKALVLSPDETTRLWSAYIDENNDKPLTLPLIALTRDPNCSLTITAKRPMSWEGKIFNNENNASDHLNAIPMHLTYNLDIYTRYLWEASEFFREFAFKIINYPAIAVDIPYNEAQNIRYTSFITLGENVSESGSTIPEQLIQGEFSHIGLTLLLEDAYLFNYENRNVPRIVDIYTETN